MANNVSVKAWFNTGFNAVNIPADPSGDWADTIHSETFPALNILQHTQLTYVKIKATFPQVVDIDYVRLDPPYTTEERPNHGGNSTAFRYAYYFVTGVSMANGDTAVLSLLPDYVNTAGGWNKLKILDGITNRVTIKKSDDVFGRFTNDDPYLVPSEDLELHTETIDITQNGYKVYVESTADLGVMAVSGMSDIYKTSGSTETVAVPKVYPNFHRPTKYGIRKGNTVKEGNGNKSVVYFLEPTGDSYPVSLGGGYFVYNDNIIQRGIERCRSLGVEEVVLNTAVIPDSLVEPYETLSEVYHYINVGYDTGDIIFQEIDSITDPAGDPVVISIRKTSTIGALDENEFVYKDENGNEVEQSLRAYPVIDTMYGKMISKTMSHNLLSNENSYDNKRVLYGKYHKNGILTNSGSRYEATPEEIKPSSGGTVQIEILGDPHLDGKPYFRFRYVHGQDGANLNQSFFENCVTGMRWKQIPLIYTQKSGGFLDAENYNSKRAIDQIGHGYDVNLHKLNAPIAPQAPEEFDFLGKVTELVRDTAMGIGGGGLVGGPLGALAGGAAAAGAHLAEGLDMITNSNEKNSAYTQALQEYERNKKVHEMTGARDLAMYSVQAENEKRQFLTSQNVFAPTVQFPYANEGYRDFYGDNAIYYYYSPTSRDLARFDKILNMYGYSVKMPFTKDIINNRNHFVYIEANCSVGGDIPKWLADGVAMQISNGVRLWKVRPSETYYASGGNV